MTLHYELPTTADFAALAGPHQPAVTIYASTSPVVSERERAEVAVKSAFDDAIEQVRATDAPGPVVEDLRSARDAILTEQRLWGRLSRSMAIFVAPGFSEVFVLPNRLDDAVHVGSHFTLGQLLRAPSQDQEAYAITLSGNEWALWHATPTDRAAQLDVDQAGTANLDEATNREPGEERPRGYNRGVGGVASQGGASRLMGGEGRKTLLDLYAKRVGDVVRRELLQRDPDERVPLFAFAAEPLLSLFLERSKNSRRIVGVPGAPDRLGASEIDEAVRQHLAKLNISEAERDLRGLVNGAAGRVERDLAAIAREAADGAVETFWFDFTTSVNGTLDRESGAVEFATGNGSGEHLSDGTLAGDLLPQLALLVIAKGGKVVTVRGDDLDGSVWSGPAMAELRFALG
ncbi:baeRF11 domain-containing protein [Agromyces bauzanensis]